MLRQLHLFIYIGRLYGLPLLEEKNMKNIIKQLDAINNFCMEEYGNNADTSNYRTIGLLYCTFEDESDNEKDIQVDINIIDHVIIAYNPYNEHEIYNTTKYTIDELESFLDWSTLYDLHP